MAKIALKGIPDGSATITVQPPNSVVNRTLTLPDSDGELLNDTELAASGGSALVGFLQDGTGATARTLQDKLRDVVSVKDFGAVGDGVADDTAAIQAALNTGLSVFIPPTTSYYKISAALNLMGNQKIFGEGRSSLIRQTTPLASVLSASGKEHVTIEGLGIYCTGDFTNLSTGCGVLLVRCSHSKISKNTFENCRGWAVTLRGTNDSIVSENSFINAPATGIVDDSDIGGDIQAIYGSSRNTICNNKCNSGSGTAIKIQSVVNGDFCDDNIITGNTVKNYSIYGIIAYRNAQAIIDVPLQSVLGTVISGNTVDTITGAVPNSILGTYTYGAGIYLQGAEGSVVCGNIVSNTHAAAVAFAETLAPGGIGITNLSRCSVTGNIITGCGFFGVDIHDANNFGDVAGGGVIADNVISRCTRGGIRVRERGRVSISGNIIDTTGRSGIGINNTATIRKWISIVGNTVRNTTGTGGIEVAFADADVKNNTVDTCSVHGITAANSTSMVVTGNSVRNHVTRGIQIQSSVTGAIVKGNVIIGFGSSAEGIRLDGNTSVDKSNVVSGCTLAWNGAYAVLRGTQSGTAVGNVGTGEDNLGQYALPPSSMVATGDTLKVSAWGTTANNANAKTLKFYFGSSLVLSSALTTGQAGTWGLEAEIVRTGPNAQRCYARLIQGGGTVLTNVSYVAASQSESLEIVAKITGEGTSNHDILQLGMLVSFLKG